MLLSKYKSYQLVPKPLLFVKTRNCDCIILKYGTQTRASPAFIITCVIIFPPLSGTMASPALIFSLEVDTTRWGGPVVGAAVMPGVPEGPPPASWSGLMGTRAPPPGTTCEHLLPAPPFPLDTTSCSSSSPTCCPWLAWCSATLRWDSSWPGARGGLWVGLLLLLLLPLLVLLSCSCSPPP